MPNPEDYQLRSIEESDLEQVLEWRNSERVRSNMYTDYIISLEEHRAWFLKIRNSSSTCYYVCEYDKQPIGVIYFTNIDKKNQKSYWGFYLGDENAPIGSGYIMGFTALKYAFEVLDFRKLCSEVFEFNIKSIKLHNKLGFQQEGYFVKHILKKDRHEDVIALALFKDNWLNIKDNLYEYNSVDTNG